MESIFRVFFTNCSKMEKIRTIIGEIAALDVPVLVKGETGTGKSLVSQAIHQESNRRGKPLIKVNCAAIPHNLLESELFGFDKGAFTGASLKKPGKFELANGGTILLNDIGEIDISLQAKLLQVLQDGEFARLGGEGDVPVNARIVTTTKDDLERSIAQGRFREDRYFRINVISITVPPLRERKEQIIPLAQYFFEVNRKKFGKPTPFFSPQSLKFFQEYDWPGNIRELENMVKRAILFREEEAISGSLLRAREGPMPALPPLREGETPGPKNLTLRRIGREAAEVAEKKYIHKALQETHWKRKEAAKILQISYKALLYKIKKYRLNERKNLKELMEELGWPSSDHMGKGQEPG